MSGCPAITDTRNCSAADVQTNMASSLPSSSFEIVNATPMDPVIDPPNYSTALGAGWFFKTQPPSPIIAGHYSYTIDIKILNNLQRRIVLFDRNGHSPSFQIMPDTSVILLREEGRQIYQNVLSVGGPYVRFTVVSDGYNMKLYTNGILNTNFTSPNNLTYNSSVPIRWDDAMFRWAEALFNRDRSDKTTNSGVLIKNFYWWPRDLSQSEITSLSSLPL
jgi:hypothetical protein